MGLGFVSGMGSAAGCDKKHNTIWLAVLLTSSASEHFTTHYSFHRLFSCFMLHTVAFVCSSLTVYINFNIRAKHITRHEAHSVFWSWLSVVHEESRCWTVKKQTNREAVIDDFLSGSDMLFVMISQCVFGPRDTSSLSPLTPIRVMFFSFHKQG